MRSRRWLLALAVSASASGGCSALTGLDQIREEDCAPDCGASAADATADHAIDAAADVGPQADAGDGGAGPDAGGEAAPGDAADAMDARDAGEAGDAGDAADAGDARDAANASDAMDASDARDATGTVDAAEAGATDAADAGAATDASDAADSGTRDTGVDSADAGPLCPLAGVVFGEVRSRGAGGAADEFIVLFNPTGAPVTLDGTWTIQARSASADSFSTRWTGSGAAIPAHGFYLVAGSTYAGSPAADAHLTSGITDATALRLGRSGTVVDTFCYRYDAATLATLQDAAYGCEGTPADNTPHDDSASSTSDVDQSLRRAHCVDTGDSSADFAKQAPATPRSTASPPEP